MTNKVNKKKIELRLGDCLIELKKLEENSVDSIVTDPPYELGFMGSGSTGCACVKNGFDFIGIELEPDYCKIAEARINSVKKEPEQEVLL